MLPCSRLFLPRRSRSPQLSAFPFPAPQVVLERRRPISPNNLFFLELAGFQNLLGIDQGTQVSRGELTQPIQRTRRNPPTHRHGKIDRSPVPLHFSENDDDLPVIRFHPLGQRATLGNPAAVEIVARVNRSVQIVVAALAGAVRAGMPRVHRDAVDDHLDPTIAARRAGLACSLVHARNYPGNRRWAHPAVRGDRASAATFVVAGRRPATTCEESPRKPCFEASSARPQTQTPEAACQTPRTALPDKTRTGGRTLVAHRAFTRIPAAGQRVQDDRVAPSPIANAHKKTGPRRDPFSALIDLGRIRSCDACPAPSRSGGSCHRSCCCRTAHRRWCAWTAHSRHPGCTSCHPRQSRRCPAGRTGPSA